MIKSFKLPLVLMVLALALLAGCRATERTYLTRGKRLVEKKEYARAVLEFKNASKLNPTSAEPYYQAGLAYLDMAEYRTAYIALGRATQLDPKHAGAQEKLAEIIESSIANTRDPEALKEAEQCVQSALAIVPDSPDALSALGLTEYLLGKPNDAVNHLQAALEKFPQHLQSARALAVIKLKQKDFPGAEQVLKKVAEDSPKSAEVQLALARFYVLNHGEAQAEAVYRRALSIDPKYGPALLDLAQLQFATGHKEDAEKT